MGGIAVSTPPKWRRYLRLFGPDVASDVDDELAFHIEMRTRENIARGMTPEAARAEALRRFGDVDRARADCVALDEGVLRSAKRRGAFGAAAQDLGFAVRLLRRSPGFTAVAVLTLALGIGATTAIFSVVDGVLLKPLPYPDADRLVTVLGRFLPESGFDFPAFPLSPPEYYDYRAQSRALEDVAAYYSSGATIASADGDPVRVQAATASANLFDVLGVAPALGRAFTAAEDVPQGPSVAILSHGLWQTAYGGDPAIVGRSIRVNDRPATVVGVMPSGFSYPGRDIALWLPIGLDPAQRDNRAAHFVLAVGRLAPDAELAQAHAEMSTLMARWKADYPTIHTGHFLFLRPLRETTVGGARPVLLVLLGAVGFVLLIVCANVANLLLARGEGRRREFAVRAALGAGRGRMVRQLLTESLLLAAVGGALGVGLAWLAVEAILGMSAGAIPRAHEVAVDGGVLLFAATLVVLTSVLFGLGPALGAGRTAPQATLRDGGRAATAGRARYVLRRGLVAAEVALAFLVVVGAGLMIRSFRALVHVDPGFRAEHVLLARLALPAGRYTEPADVAAFHTRLRERLAALPGVRTAGAISAFPLIDGAPNIDFQIEGAPERRPGEPASSGDFSVATPGFLEAAGVELVRGRFFTGADDAEAPLVAVVNRTAVRLFWPDGDPLGRRIRLADTAPWVTIVGVVGDVQYSALDADPRPAWYVPQAQMARSFGSTARTLSHLVRTDGDPAALADAVRAVVHDLDPGLAFVRLEPLESIVDESVARPRFTTTLLGLFAALALALGAIGIYGVVAYSVARRTRELGIRRALGASAGRTAGLVLKQGLVPTLIGLTAGLGLAAAATRWLSSLLYEVSPLDPATYLVVTVVLACAATAACLVPTWRALRLSPAASLHIE